MFRMICSLCRALFLALMLAWLPAHAVEGKNPEGFNTPDGYQIERSQNAEFQKIADSDRYICVASKKPCTVADGGFDEAGRLKLEGKTESVWYGKSGGGPVAGLLLQRNYERVLQEMGGRLVATMVGQDEGRGWMKQVLLVERASQRKWILVNTFANSKQAWVTVVTVGNAPNILLAGELLKEIDAHGFATLNVNFETNKALIRASDQPALDEVVELMKRTPGLRLSVDGHTDSVGNADANKLLSQQRADAIVAYLVRAGVVGDRLQAKGFGMGQPVADNRSEEGRAKNRRVELVKLK